MFRRAAFIAAAPCATAFKASTVCVYNEAGIVGSFKLRDEQKQTETHETGDFAITQTRCIEVADLEGVNDGDSIVPVVHAVLGKDVEAEPVEFDAINAVQVTYVCKGVSFDYSCHAEAPPPPAGEIAKDIGEFVLGFVVGLGQEMGFADCIDDIEGTYKDLQETVSFFENGINKQSQDYVVKAFEKIGKLVFDFAKAIAVCVKDAVDLVNKFKDLASALSGNVLDIVKVVVEEGIHIYQHREDLTKDCKAVAADWTAGDFEGSGHAVGDIVGILLSGLEEEKAKRQVVV